jgi:glycosyltransferase involved in cell wall biosynthesis
MTVFAIDATRIRSGGAVAHAIGLIAGLEGHIKEGETIHFFSYRTLLDQLGEFPWLVKEHRQDFEGTLVRQLLWQKWKLEKELKLINCDLLFSLSATTLTSFKPLIALSQDLASYEKGIMSSYPLGMAYLRLVILRLIQNQTFNSSDANIFLTEYARDLIGQSCPNMAPSYIIPHGVQQTGFSAQSAEDRYQIKPGGPMRCLYVSPVWPYKNHLAVVHGFKKLVEEGLKLELVLVGDDCTKEGGQLKKHLQSEKETYSFVKLLGNRPIAEVQDELNKADVFVFASSCENLPVTLLEAMSVGLPILSSDLGPMPEVAQDAVIYFDPQCEEQLTNGLRTFYGSHNDRRDYGDRARRRAKLFTWDASARLSLDVMRGSAK